MEKNFLITISASINVIYLAEENTISKVKGRTLYPSVACFPGLLATPGAIILGLKRGKKVSAVGGTNNACLQERNRLLALLLVLSKQRREDLNDGV